MRGALIIALLAVLPAAAAKRPTNVCEIAEHWRTMNGVRVTVEAPVRAGTHYEIFLSGEKCQRIIGLAIPARLDDSPQIKKLRRLVFAGFPAATRRAQASGVFTCTLRVTEVAPNHHRVALDLESVSAVNPWRAN